MVLGYPKVLTDEFPHIPFESVDSAFSIGSSVFFFNGFDFWQNTWESNTTRSIPFKTNAAISWINPGAKLDYKEPLAYLVSDVSMHQFNYWNIFLQTNNADIRYFLFDCLGTNPKPEGKSFLGPTYNNTRITDDIVVF